MRTLVLLRHGNTFAPGDKVVMVGAHEDLPLVETGLAQAEAMRKALAPFRPDAVYAAPLARTRRFAEIVSPLPPRLDVRLAEIDYGLWSGLSDAEIEARGDSAALKAWRDSAAWPSHFPESESAALARTRAFAAERTETLTYAVTSQGILRLLLRLAPKAFEERRRAGGLQVKTGHGCVLRYEGAYEVVGWNLNPEALAAALLV